MQMRKTNPAGLCPTVLASLTLSRRAALLAALTSLGSLSIGAPAIAKTKAWPAKPVRLVTFGPPGASPDLAARIWSEKLSAHWRQPVVVDNKPGGDGVIAVQAMLAAKDGHTLFFGPNFIYTALHNTNHEIAIRPRDEMVPICATNIDFIAVAVSPKLPVSSLAELKGYAKAHPGTLNWYAPSGSSLWFRLSDFFHTTDARTLSVPYRGAPQAIIDLSADRLHVVMMPLAPLVSQAEAGTVRLIATMGSRRPAAVPAIPTAAEQGMPEMTIDGVFGLYAPKTTLGELMDQIGADVHAVAAEHGLSERFERIGQSLRPLSKAQFTAELLRYEQSTADLVRKYKAKAN